MFAIPFPYIAMLRHVTDVELADIACISAHTVGKWRDGLYKIGKNAFDLITSHIKTLEDGSDAVSAISCGCSLCNHPTFYQGINHRDLPLQVYIIGGTCGPIKIGQSTYPPKRLDVLQTSFPYRLWIHHSWEHPAANLIEKKCHLALTSRRLCGEWFDCSVGDASSMIKRIIKSLSTKEPDGIAEEFYDKKWSNWEQIYNRREQKGGGNAHPKRRRLLEEHNWHLNYGDIHAMSAYRAWRDGFHQGYDEGYDRGKLDGNLLPQADTGKTSRKRISKKCA